MDYLELAVNALMQDSHNAAVEAGWRDHQMQPGTNFVDPRLVDVPQSIALIHSEISEALQADRKNAMDNHLPHRLGLEVELADAMIRICDLAGAKGLDLGGAYVEKRAYNEQRADHKAENRAKPDGKKY